MTENSTQVIPGVIIGLLILLFAVFCIFMIIKTGKSRKKIVRERKEKMLEYNAQESGVMQHIYGLDVPESAPCEFYICQDKYIFIRNNTEMKLSFDKITDVSLRTNREIQTQYVSSAGGAVGGALLLGPLGAIIGGRTKKKTDISTTTYLIIAYDKNGETSYICFLVQNFKLSQKCISAFKNSPSFHQKKSIDL